MRVKLPNGLIDGADLFNYAQIDELRGKQQNYLADRDLVNDNIGHVPRILADMILSLETEQGLQWQGKMSDAVEKLPSGDLETLLIKIRENTYGPRFYHEGPCPHCKHNNKNLRLDLDKLEVDFMSVEEMLKPKAVELPKSKKVVELKPSYLKDIFTLIGVLKNKSNALITSIISLYVKRIDQNNKISDKSLEDIPSTDLMYLQEQVEKIKLQGEIDTDIDIKCEKCEKEFTMKLNCFDASFFEPTRGSTNTNT